MKKFIVYILLALTFIISSLEITVFAETTLKNSTIENNKIAALETTIPKPTLLPGPSETEQADKGQREVLTSRILPAFAIGLIGFVGGLSLLFLVISGVRFVTAYGNEEKIEKAKNQAMYAVIGFLIALLSYTIVRVVTSLRISGDVTERPEQAETTEQVTPKSEQEDPVYFPGEEEPDKPIIPGDKVYGPGEEEPEGGEIVPVWGQ